MPRAFWALAALVFAAAALPYLQTFAFDFVSLDDGDYVRGNERVKGGLSFANAAWAFTTFKTGNYHPLTWLSHMLDVSLFGASAGPHHLVSALLHACNASLLFYFFARATGAPGPSALVALLFAVHPLRVESVAWISERKDLLAALFFLLCLVAYRRWAATLERRYYGLALAAFLAGLLCKPMLVTLPPLLLLLDVWPLRRTRDEPVFALWLEKLPFFALSLAASVVTLVAQREGGALRTLEAVSAEARLGNAVLGYAGYLAKTAWPASLAVFYPARAESLPLVQAALGAVALSLSAALAWRKRDRFPAAAVGWLWFLGMLVPVSGILQAGSQLLADRYTYLPSVGLAAAVAFTPWPPAWRRPLAALGLAVCAVLLVLSFRQVRTWRDSETLFRHAARVVPDNWYADFKVAQELASTGRHAEAIPFAEAALAVDPSHELSHLWLSRSLAATGRVEEALSHQAALARSEHLRPRAEREAVLLLEKLKGDLPRLEALAARHPDFMPVLHALGVALFRAGRAEEARRALEDAVRLSPGSADAHFALGTLHAKEGRVEEARRALGEAVRLAPDADKPRRALERLGDERR